MYADELLSYRVQLAMAQTLSEVMRLRATMHRTRELAARASSLACELTGTGAEMGLANSPVLGPTANIIRLDRWKPS